MFRLNNIICCLSSYVMILYATYSYVKAQNNFGVCCPYAGWDYVLPITITNNGSTPTPPNQQTVFVINTQTPIAQGKMHPNGDDIRFTDGTCGNFLPYYIESGINTPATYIWVRLPSIPAGGSLTIYMYYGHSSAPAAAVPFNAMFPTVLTINAPTTLSGTQSYDWIEVQPGGTITMPANGTPPVFQARKIIFNGTYNGNNLGYPPQSGPGAGGNGVGSVGGGGGGYGGSGGSGGGPQGFGGPTYGTPAGPDIDKGSGGGGSDCPPSAAGGGAISFIGGVLEINGNISVNGQNAQNCCCGNTSEAAGGGAGGGVLMEGDYISGTASISARGGNGGNSDDKEGGGGGGGGRVKIRWVMADNFSGSVNVSGGAPGIGDQSGMQPGQPGTFQRPQIPGLVRSVGTEVPVSIPTAQFTFNNVCVQSQASFTDASSVQSGGSITQWAWNFGDGTTSNQPNPTHVYTSANTYPVTLTVTSVTGCTHTTTQTITVSSIPVADFTAPDVCENNPTPFTDASSGGVTQWSWSFGDGNSSTLQNPLHTYTAAGTYQVTLTVATAANCSHTVIKPVVVATSPVANFSTQNVCVGGQSVFTDASTTASGTIVQWNWNFGDGNSSAQQSPVHTYASAGTYDVTLTVTSSGGCPNTNTKQVVIYPLPVAAFSASAVCRNEVTPFADASSISNGSIVQWLWNFGDGNTSTQPNPSHTYANDGSYQVSLLVTSDHGCSRSITQSVEIHPLPIANFDVNDVCLGTPVTFTDRSGTGGSSQLTQWQWSFGEGGAISSDQHPIYTYSNSGSYVVSLTVTNSHNCTATTSRAVSVHENPTVVVDATPACYGENNGSASATASGGVGPYSYRWDNNSQTASNLNLSTGNYSLTVTDGNGCTVAGTIFVPEYPEPVIPYASPDSMRIIFGDTIQVTISSNYDPNVLYSISPSYNISCHDCSSLQAFPFESTTYSVTATDLITGCRGTSTFTINVDEKYILFVPNAFTPNGDGVNDHVKAYAKALKYFYFRIFNRWGELVFYTDDIHASWDGTYKGKPAEAGVYVYQAKLGYLNGVTREVQGSITLIK